MKGKIVFVIFLLSTSLCSCSTNDDDDNFEVKPTGTKVISSILLSYEDGASGNMAYNYNSDGELIKMESNYIYYKVDGTLVEELSVFDIAYGINEVVLTFRGDFISEDYDEHKMTHILNSEGLVSEINKERKDIDSEGNEDVVSSQVLLTYNNGGYLTMTVDDDFEPLTYTWSSDSDNIVKTIYGTVTPEINTISYTDFVDKTNLDLNSIIETIYEPNIYFPGMIKKIGKRGENHILKQVARKEFENELTGDMAWSENISTYTYTFDKDGYPIKVDVSEISKFSHNEDVMNRKTLTYNIKYNY